MEKNKKLFLAFVFIGAPISFSILFFGKNYLGNNASITSSVFIWLFGAVLMWIARRKEPADEQIKNDLDGAALIIERAAFYGLTTEVVTTALKAMKDDPELEIIEALRCGMDEWDID